MLYTTLKEFHSACYLFLCVVLFVGFGGGAEAKNKRIDKEILKIATDLAKDREASYSGEDAMPLADFQTQWTAFVKRLDDEYQGHTIDLKTFGTDVGIRKAFTHLLYMALRVQQQSTLTPLVQEVISRHPFLQELVIEGACYTGGDAFPKKMKDLLKASPEMQSSIRAQLDKWEKKYRQMFEKEFGTVDFAG